MMESDKSPLQEEGNEGTWREKKLLDGKQILLSKPKNSRQVALTNDDWDEIHSFKSHETVGSLFGHSSALPVGNLRSNL